MKALDSFDNLVVFLVTLVCLAALGGFGVILLS